jgi:small-conductance mechanosensitive channel/CRP-like cAMP-binding protein
MADTLRQDWVVWAIVIAVGVPVLIVVLTEVLGALQRRGSPAAKPVRFLRNWVVPVGALLGFLAFAVSQPADDVWVKIVATLLGFLVILLVLSAFNVALFANAQPGSWRERIPSIFVDIARLVLIVVGLAILFQWVWNADVAGLFAALGVSSIIIGLALQNAVGGVISGLLLLFEQPFEIGDWLDTGSVRGRVIEVNWRAVHIDTGSGIQIVPNASLAGASFTNLSQPAGAFHVEVETTFATDDPPDAVIDVLLEVAAGLPMLALGDRASAMYLGASKYRIDLPVRGPAEEADAVGLFLQRLWYAARRAGLALDGDAMDPIAEPGRLEEAVAAVASIHGIDGDDLDRLVAEGSLERYGIGETVQVPDTVPGAMRFVAEGALQLWAGIEGGRIDVATAEVGEYVGQTTLTREPAFLGATAIDVTTVIVVPLATIDALVRARPVLARNIGQSIEAKRRLASEALATAGVVRGTLLSR